MTTPELCKKNDESMRFCKNCQKWVVMSGFNYAVKEIGKFKNMCKACEKKYLRDYRKRPEVIEKEKKRNAERVKRGDFRKKKPCAIAGGFRAQ